MRSILIKLKKQPISDLILHLTYDRTLIELDFSDAGVLLISPTPGAHLLPPRASLCAPAGLIFFWRLFVTFDLDAFRGLYIKNLDVKAYVAKRHPDLHEMLEHYLKYLGPHCPSFIACLKVLWSEEVKLNGTEFRQHLERWGYAPSGKG